jgi:hypothetical protein
MINRAICLFLLATAITACVTDPAEPADDSPEITQPDGKADVIFGPCRWDTDCGSDGACVNNACTDRCDVRPPCTNSAGQDTADCQYHACTYDVNTQSLCIAGDTLGTYIAHHHQEGWASSRCLAWAPNGQICPRGAFDQTYVSCSGEP